MFMLHIKNISVSVADGNESKYILKDCSLLVKPGQIHVLMGPNGSGKSSLVYTLMGHPSYEVTSGSVTFCEKNLLEMSTHMRSKDGLYLSMQQPETIAGLQVLSFLKEIYVIHIKKTLPMVEFLEIVRPLLHYVGLAESMLYRSVNDSFSGGEKKRFELLQMMLLKPKLCLLDELDSGVDIDGLQLIAQSLQLYREQNPESSMIIVTHYRRILQYLQPDVVHVMIDGNIVATGGVDLIDVIEQQGYERYAKRSE